MKKKVLGLLMITLSLTLVGCGTKKEDNNKTNNNNDLTTDDRVGNKNTGITADKTVGNYSITNISVNTINEGKSIFEAKVTNTSDKALLDHFNIILKDKDGNILTTLYAYIGAELDKNAHTTIHSESDIDLTNATTLEINMD